MTPGEERPEDHVAGLGMKVDELLERLVGDGVRLDVAAGDGGDECRAARELRHLGELAGAVGVDDAGGSSDSSSTSTRPVWMTKKSHLRSPAENSQSPSQKRVTRVSGQRASDAIWSSVNLGNARLAQSRSDMSLVPPLIRLCNHWWQTFREESLINIRQVVRMSSLTLMPSGTRSSRGASASKARAV